MRKPVLIIFYQFNPWNTTIGGIQTIIKSFIKYAPSEFDVRLVGTGDVNSVVGKWQEAEYANRVIQFMPILILKNDNVRNLIPTTIKYTLALLGKSFTADFMHFHRLEPTIAARKWSGEKTLFIHNDIYQQMNQQGKQKSILWQRFPQGYFALERSLISQFTEIFSCNTESEKLYKQLYPTLARRISYLKNTVDNEIFYPLSNSDRQAGRRTLAKELKVADRTSFILFAGRLHPQKDPILLVRSLAVLNLPDTHLLIAGDGELANDVRAEIARLGLSARVTMLGATSQAEVARLQRLASVFVLTSAYEGLPLVVLEALACGTPVVTTKCGETPNLLNQQSGLVCPERSPNAVAEAMCRILLKASEYPVDACVQSAAPYSAETVVGQIYKQMWQRWERTKIEN